MADILLTVYGITALSLTPLGFATLDTKFMQNRSIASWLCIWNTHFDEVFFTSEKLKYSLKTERVVAYCTIFHASLQGSAGVSSLCRQTKRI